MTKETTVRLKTLSGIKVLHLHLGEDGLVESVTVDMGEAEFSVPSLISTPDGSLRESDVQHWGICRRGTFVSMGNPHFVCFVQDVELIDVEHEGYALETAPIFPERCNIEFVSVNPDGTIRMRVWERGSGITLACGTGACAAAVAAKLTGRAGDKQEIVMDGGTLQVELRDNGHVYLTGPAVTVFDGTLLLR